MKTSSCKAKGRSLQNFVRDSFRNMFKITLEDGDIESRQMGGTGTDIILSPSAKKLIPFDCECKNQEKLNIWKAIEQAESNSEEGRIPLLIFKKNNIDVYVSLSFENFIKLIEKEIK